MRVTDALIGLAVVTNTASAQYEATKYYDATSGITYSSITHDNGVTYRVALPENGTVSDAILQIVSPNTFAWCGFAWGGHMTQNPLSVGWATQDPTGQQAIISSRIAYGYYAVPYPNEAAEYTYLKGTVANETHWQVTTRCQGCTIWSSADGDFDLHTQTEAVVAYACSSVPPEEPKNNASLFNIHEQFGIWSHDLTVAKNEDFGALVESNQYGP